MRIFFCRMFAVGIAGLLMFEDAAAAELSARIVAAREAAGDITRPVAERIKAIRRLGDAEYAAVSVTLIGLLATNQPENLRLVVVRAFESLGHSEAVTPLLSGWSGYSPALRQQVLHTLTARRELAGEFLAQLEHGTFPLANIDAATRQRLANFPDDAIVARAKKIFARQPWLDARATFERFKPALALKGDADKGREVFKERGCVNCHRIGDEGYFVGADLFTAREMSRADLLQQIVAPNLFFMPNFQAFLAETSEGELIEGVMAASTETTVTLRQATGIDRVLNRASLKRLKGLNVSLMPEGLLEGLPPQNVADLLEFIKNLRGF